MPLSSSLCSVVIDQSPALQIRAELLEGKPGATFDSAERDVGKLCDLTLRVSTVVSELDHLPLLGGQTAQSLSDGAPLQRLGDLSPGVGTGAGGSDLDPELELVALACWSAAEVVDRPVPNDGQHPGAQ